MTKSQSADTAVDTVLADHAAEGVLESRRAMRTLAVKRALIRAGDEAHLCRDVCEAITESDAYPLAWIGLPENDSRKSVRIAAGSGSGNGYLDTVTVTWGEDLLGNGPVGTCIRTGQIMVFNDTENESRFVPWRKQAAQFGFRSVAAVPLKCDGRVIGALTVYAREWEAFHREEVCLLEELAADLSNGLELRVARRSQARAAEALLQAGTEFRTIFDSTNDAIFIADFEARFLEVNQAACRSLGYSRDELLSKTVFDIDAVESRELLPGRLETIRREGAACFESVQVRRDGTLVPVELNVRAITYRGIPAHLGVARDIGERKRTEAELNLRTAEMARLKAEAENANRAKSEFLANVSHEIRTPLNGILGFANLMAGTQLTSEQREYNDAVRTSAEHLLFLINDLLDFSRIEAGRVELETIPFSVRGCIEQAARPLRPQAEGKGLAMFVEVAKAVPEWVQGDPNRVRQVLLNLIGNAVKFTKSGGIGVRVSIAENWRNTNGAQDQGLQFAVTDTGIGIPEAQKAVIFEPFRQADGTITRRFGGTGLGLTISSRIVALMNGRIWFETREGFGSTFYFIIPLIAGREPETVLAGKFQSGPGQPVKRNLSILVGEDNPLNQRLIRKLLEMRGHRVSIHSTGKAVVSNWEDHDSDLILMDLQMPEMDGMEATRWIRETEASTGSHIPIVAMTACAMAEDREKCLRAGFDAYLCKPLDIQELDNVLAACMSKEIPSVRFKRNDTEGPNTIL